jgi:3'(2'), 5'-bisphosphate nucleotidase
VRGEVQIGVLGCPELSLGLPDRGALVFAVRGHGAFRAPLTGEGLTALHVSSRSDPRLARVLRSVEDAHMDVAKFKQVLRTLAATPPPTLMDSQAKHAVIAAGQGDLFLRLPAGEDYRDRIWDQAAGAIIVGEAGGRVTDVRGIELDFSAGRTLARNQGVAASNGHLHAALLRTLRSLDGREGDPASGGH